MLQPKQPQAGSFVRPMLQFALLTCFFVGSHSFAGLPLMLRTGAPASISSRSAVITMAVDPAKVEKFVSKGEKAVDAGKAKRVAGKLQKAMNKPSGAVSVAVECSAALPLKADDLKACYQIAGENGISQNLRAGNAGALWIERSEDGSDIDAIQAFVKEQNSAKGDFPGPVIVVRGGVSSVEEAAEAAAAGAGAIGIDMASVGAEAEDLVLAAKGMELECVAVARSSEEAAAGVEADAGLVLAIAEAEADFSAIRKGLPDKMAHIARVEVALGAGDESLDDAVKLGRELHSSGYTAVLLAGLCTDETNSLELPFQAIKEITSKRSSKVQVKTIGVRDAQAGGAVGLAAATSGEAAPSEAAPAKVKKVRPANLKKKAAAKKTPVGQDTWGLDEYNMEDEEDYDAAFYEKMPK